MKMIWKRSCRIELYAQVNYYHSAFWQSLSSEEVTESHPCEGYSLGKVVFSPTEHVVFSSAKRDVCG